MGRGGSGGLFTKTRTKDVIIYLQGAGKKGLGDHYLISLPTCLNSENLVLTRGLRKKEKGRSFLALK